MLKIAFKQLTYLDQFSRFYDVETVMVLNEKIKKNRFKPVFKKLIAGRVCYTYNLKIFAFKKNKWLNVLFHLKNSYKKTKYNKYRLIDQNKTLLNRKNSLELHFPKYFKKKIINNKMLKIFFGHIKNKHLEKIKKTVLKSKQPNKVKNLLFKTLESRLDYVLLKSKLFISLRSVRNAIANKYISVNKKSVTKCSMPLKSGDFIKINKSIFSSQPNITKLSKWPLISSCILINYNTLEICFLGSIKKQRVNFNYYPFFMHLLLI